MTEENRLNSDPSWQGVIKWGGFSNRKQTIRDLIIFAILVNGLAWLGPILGGRPEELDPGEMDQGAGPRP